MPPYSHIRPLSGLAAERAWARAAPLAAAASPASVEPHDQLDLGATDDWDADSVARWLLSRGSDPEQRVLVCYQPRVVVSVPWAVLCDHWLVFFWTAACVCDPAGAWVLVHDGDRFFFRRSR